MIEDLYNSKRDLENKIDNYTEDGSYTGDRSYQDLLERLEDIESEIEEYEND